GVYRRRLGPLPARTYACQRSLRSTGHPGSARWRLLSADRTPPAAWTFRSRAAAQSRAAAAGRNLLPALGDGLGSRAGHRISAVRSAASDRRSQAAAAALESQMTRREVAPSTISHSHVADDNS